MTITEFINPTDSTQRYTAQLLTGHNYEVPMPTINRPYYSRLQRYNCNCCKLGCTTGCDEKGYRCYQVNIDGDNHEIWICAIHEQICSGVGELTIVPDGHIWEVNIPTGVQNADGTMGTISVECDGGCLDMATALTQHGRLSCRRVPPAANSEEFMTRWRTMEALRFWDHLTPGTKRGCEILVGNSWQHVKELIWEHLPHLWAEFERMEEADGKRFYVVLAAGYVGEGRESKSEGRRIMFYKHCDRIYYGKGYFRTNITLFTSSTEEDGRPKCTRFSNRRTGQWVSIISRHGFILEGDDYVYGCDESHEIEHAIYDARNTVTITIDHGPREDYPTQAEIDSVAGDVGVHGDNNNGDNDGVEGQVGAVDDSIYRGDDEELHLPEESSASLSE